MVSLQYVTFLAPRRIHRVESGHRCVRRAVRRYDLGNKRRPPGIRTRVPPRIYNNKVVAHIAPVSLFLPLCVSYIPIELLSLFTQEFHVNTRTRVRRELLRRRVSIRQIARVENPSLPNRETDVRHVWSFAKIGQLEQLGNFRLFFLSFLSFFLFKPLFLALALSLPSVSP